MFVVFGEFGRGWIGIGCVDRWNDGEVVESRRGERDFDAGFVLVLVSLSLSLSLSLFLYPLLLSTFSCCVIHEARIISTP